MQKKPWDIPPRPTTYDRDSEVAAVGGALSAWQYVEDAIASIFQALVNEGDPQKTVYVNSISPAQRAYGSIASFTARADMVEAAAEAFFYVHQHSEFQDRLAQLLKASRSWAGRRNEIAHAKIAGAPIDLNCCALWPAESSTNKNKVDYHAKFVYNSVQIRKFERQFMNLHDLFLGFEMDFRVWRLKQLGVHPWLDQPPSALDTMADQTPIQ